MCRPASFFNAYMQSRMIRMALRGFNPTDASIDQSEYGAVLKEALNLPKERWAEASKMMHNLDYWSGLKQLPVEQLAALANGRTEDHSFLRDFFEDVFGGNEEQLQKDLLEHLDPEVFQFEGASEIDIEIWDKFLNCSGRGRGGSKRNIFTTFD
ncbi:MAG: hypothetical protein HWD61_06935 [Parachlamydiaceae bacterium]|nr:MAG: hypothetical protein HWD61_06935 [Parachlamydiaceae bacterium]